MQFYLYGKQSPEIWASVKDPSFQAWVRELFATNGQSPLPGDPSESFHKAARQGLLSIRRETYGAGERLILIPAAAQHGLLERLEIYLGLYVEIAAATAAELCAAYEEVTSRRHFDWHAVHHTVVAGMFLDLAVGNELTLAQKIQREHDDTVIWAFEHLGTDSGFGVQWAAGGPRVVFSQLWHHGLRREQARLSEALAGLLARIDRGEEYDPASKELLYARFLGLVKKQGKSLRLEVPTFAPADTERLLPILARAARQLVETAIFPAFETAAEHPWWQSRIAQDACRHAFVRLMLEYGAQRTIAARIVEPFPPASHLPPAWGRWLWSEGDGATSLIPGMGRRREGSA